MTALEEKYFKAVKADASLYNGQPFDTGPMCYSVGVTPSMPSIQKNKDGVAVENVHSHSKQWFVLGMSYGRVLKVKEVIEVLNIQSKLGDRGDVTNGDFEGVLDRKTRIACKQIVIAEFFCGCLAATVHIPKEVMNFFMKSEQYHDFELPEYCTFDKALKYIR